MPVPPSFGLNPKVDDVGRADVGLPEGKLVSHSGVCEHEVVTGDPRVFAFRSEGALVLDVDAILDVLPKKVVGVHCDFAGVLARIDLHLLHDDVLPDHPTGKRLGGVDAWRPLREVALLEARSPDDCGVRRPRHGHDTETCEGREPAKMIRFHGNSQQRLPKRFHTLAASSPSLFHLGNPFAAPP